MRGGGATLAKIGDVCLINSRSITPSELDKSYIYIDIDAVENGTGKIRLDKELLSQHLPSRARRLATSGSTIISTVRPNLKGFAYIKEEIENGIFSTGFAILESKDDNILLNPMIYYMFMYSDDLMQQMQNAMPKGQYPSINKTNIENFIIPVLSINEQQNIITQIEQYEQQIQKAEIVINGIAERKQAVLTRYLI